MEIKRAERKRARLRLAIDGPSGSGKTYSALLIAQGIGAKIGVIDTERRSASLYAHLCEYDVIELDPPYTPKRYIEAIRTFDAAGYEVVIIDSLSHAWAGEGGALDMVDKASKADNRHNSFAAWRSVTPEHNALVDAILAAKAHLIVTLRTKTEWEIVENEKGKKEPKKIGTKPIQRDGVEYEFTVVIDLSVDDHVASVSKDRTSLLDGTHFVPSVDTGRQLKAWLEQGTEPATEIAATKIRAAQEHAREELDKQAPLTMASLFSQAKAKGMSEGEWRVMVNANGISKDKATHTPEALAIVQDFVANYQPPTESAEEKKENAA